jgi:hypothetical protein
MIARGPRRDQRPLDRRAVGPYGGCSHDRAVVGSTGHPGAGLLSARTRHPVTSDRDQGGSRGPGRRDALRAQSEAEGAPFGVPTDRPPRPGMDHASPKPPDLPKRGLHIRNGEIRQRGRVARTDTTFVNAKRRTPAVGLPAATFGLAALGELDAEQPRPEAKRAVGIISRKLD